MLGFRTLNLIEEIEQEFISARKCLVIFPNSTRNSWNLVVVCNWGTVKTLVVYPLYFIIAMANEHKLRNTM